MTKKSIDSNALLTLIEPLLNNDQSVELTVSGTSMRPLLKHNQTRVVLTKPKTITKGHIYLFKYKNKPYLHRLISIDKDLYTFCGDALIKTETVHLKDIIGHVEAIQKKNKRYNPYRFFRRFHVWCYIKMKHLKKRLKRVKK